MRDKEGQFKDIQIYKKAHGQDIKRKTKAEKAKKASSVGAPLLRARCACRSMLRYGIARPITPSP